MRKKQESVTKPAAKSGWPKRTKLIVSGLVAFHVFAVFMAPFRFSTTAGPGAPVSPFAQSTMYFFDWYIQGMFLDHGYAFFAPDPGPSHLVRYELHFDDGRETIIDTFPNLKNHWPRLLYHRHFMLSEQLNMDFMPVEPPPDVRGNPRAESAWAMDRRPYQMKWAAFEEHLKRAYGADRVVMTRVEHGLATVPEVLQGMPLDDKSLYRDLSETAPPETPLNQTPGPMMQGPVQ